MVSAALFGLVVIGVDNSKQPRNVISFCSGYAGIERGLSLAGVATRALAYVEIEAFAAANLVAKMESGFLAAAPIWSDLKTFPAHLFRDRVDLLTGGYPCQPFSAAGKRAGKDDPRHLWPWIRQHIETIRPVRCFFENVEGHISLGLREVIEDLEALGYTTTWGIFSASESEVGAPHQRKRVYILANSDSAGQQSDQRQGQARYDAGRRGQELADSDSEQQRRDSALDENTQRQTSSGTKPSWRGSDLADTNSEGSQRYAGNGKSVNKQERYYEKQDGPISPVSICERQHDHWATEPGLGRVVDGCADRVDRLRLLGNGVVPQTAAKAWRVLEQQLWQN
jgi:DNA (cytosine-5)-methyltransferase 1